MGEYFLIRNLKPGMKDLSLMFIILEVGRPSKTKEGHEVRSARIADRSGSINLSVWDDLGKLVQSGDIVRMSKGYVNVWKNCLTLYLGKNSEFQKINEFCMVFSEVPFMRYLIFLTRLLPIHPSNFFFFSEPSSELQNPERPSFSTNNKNVRPGSSGPPSNPATVRPMSGNFHQNTANGGPLNKWGSNSRGGASTGNPAPSKQTSR